MDPFLPSGYKNINIRPNDFEPDFHSQVQGALGRIKETPSGNRLLESIAHAPQNHSVIIGLAHNPASIATRPVLTDAQKEKYGTGDLVQENAKAIELSSKRRTFLGSKSGPGTNSHISWCNDYSLRLNGDAKPTLEHSTEKAHLILAHELVHASYQLRGESKGAGTPEERNDPKTKAGKEELRAVGLGKYQHTPYSENSIRRDLGEPERRRY